MALSAREFRHPANYIAARQREHPPKYQTAEGWAALFGGALDFAAPRLKRHVASGRIASGEVGELTPNASVTRIGRGCAIEMHSGLMRLIYSAARALAARATNPVDPDQSNFSLSAEQVASKISELFKNFKEKQIATAQRFPVTQDQKNWANTIAIHAETFVLMHELAHIYNEYPLSFWDRFNRKRGNAYEMEVQADATASGWLITYVLNPKSGSSQRQMFYAGAEFGLRVLMAMETVGILFETTHPHAGHRINRLREQLQRTAGLRTFYAIANTSLGFDQMWRAIEQLLLNKPPRFELTLEDVLSSMRTLVAELLRDSDINELIAVRDVNGEPGTKQVVLAPKTPGKLRILNSAREYMLEVAEPIRTSAREHASDVYEPGTIEFSILLALLNTANG